MNVSQEEDRLRLFVNDLKDRINQLETMDPISEVNIYCDNLESDVIVAFESAINHLQFLQN
ncbi:hypothetical protein ABTL40_19825, partial [Acinetobacter baumannii]